MNESNLLGCYVDGYLDGYANQWDDIVVVDN